MHVQEHAGLFFDLVINYLQLGFEFFVHQTLELLFLFLVQFYFLLNLLFFALFFLFLVLAFPLLFLVLAFPFLFLFLCRCLVAGSLLLLTRVYLG